MSSNDAATSSHSVLLLTSRQQLVVFCCCIFFTTSLAVTHRVTRSDRIWRLKASTSYEAIDVEDLESAPSAATNLKEEGKARYPMVDFLRGLCISFIVAFHIIYLCRERQLLPLETWVDRAPGLPIVDYVFFIIYFIIVFSACCGAFMVWEYLPYFVYGPAVTICIYRYWWVSQISGVCLIMLCIGMSQAISHQNGIIWRSVLRRAFKLGSVACTLTVLTYILSPDEFIYFGAIHCILVNSLLSIAFLRVPWVALLGFVLIQGYTMKYGSAPWEVPQNIPTLDVIPWFHNFGYCLLGIWLHSIGVHKMEAISLPRRRILFEETVMTTFGRHCLLIYLGHMLIILPSVIIASS